LQVADTKGTAVTYTYNCSTWDLHSSGILRSAE